MGKNNKDIKLAFISSKKDGHQKKLEHITSTLLSKEQFSVYTDINNFSMPIQNTYFKYDIILILIRERTELDKILQQKDLLEDQSIILILPDSNTEVMHQALKLYPRYLSYIQNDYQDIYLVLEKMITNINKKNKEGGGDDRDN